MLVLPPEFEATVRAAARGAYPNECCGVLMGGVSGDSGAKVVRHALPIENAQTDGERYHRFLITPEDMLAAELSARKLKMDVIGFYHSHPDHPSAPSDYDKDHALPFYSYVIVAVEKGVDKKLSSWELTPDRTDFLSEPIQNSEV